MNTTVLLTSWAAVFASFIVVMIMRWNVGRREDDHLHVLDTDPNEVVAAQSATAHRIDVLDRWKLILLTVSILYGAVILGWTLYNAWLSGATSHIG